MKKTLTRIAACSLAVLIAFNSVLVPRSKAVGAEVVGTAALATSTLAAYMTATGVSLTVTAGGAAAASAGAASLISGYAAATGGTYSVVTTALASGVTIGTGGAIIIGAAAAALLAGIVAWAINEFGLISGGESVPVYSDSGWFVNGERFPVVYYQDWREAMNFELNKVYTTSSGNEFYMRWEDAPSHDIDEFGRAHNGLVLNGERVGGGASFYDESATGFCMGQAVGYGQEDGQIFFIVYSGSFPDNCSVVAQGMGTSELYFSDLFGEYCESSLSVSLPADYEAPPKVESQYSMVIDTGMTFEDEQTFIDSVLAGVAAGTLNPTYDIEAENRDTVVPGEVTDTQAGILSWVKRIAQSIISLPQAIADKFSAFPQAIAKAVEGIFVPDAALTTEITDAFSEKFAFVPQLHALGVDLLNLQPDSEPPVVWIHLEDTEGSINYGGTVKALDMSWYERYKEDGDRIIGGFLWLGFLWALFMRVSDIINGAGMAYVLGQPTIYTPEPPNDAPRLEGSRKRGKR